MKYLAIKLIVVFLLISSAFAGAFIDYFHVRSIGEDSVIEWKTSQELNVNKFVIERRGPQTQFAEIKTIEPKGDNSFYSYTDKSIYKTNDYVFIYRLKIVDNNQQVSYSGEASISLSISGVKRTWGSIKAMFR